MAFLNDVILLTSHANKLWTSERNLLGKRKHKSGFACVCNVGAGLHRFGPYQFVMPMGAGLHVCGLRGAKQNAIFWGEREVLRNQLELATLLF